MPSTVTDRLQGLTTSLAIKPSCVVASTGNVSLATTATAAIYDGIALPSSGRILLKHQTTRTENGIYLYTGSSFERAKDFDGARDVFPGTLVPIDRGALWGGTIWTCNSSSTATSITIGTDNIDFSLFPVSAADNASDILAVRVFL